MMRSSVHKLFDAVLILIFLVVISVPCGYWMRDQILADNAPQTSVFERRVLSPSPKFHDFGVRKFPPAFERFYNDHFAFRGSILYLDHYLAVYGLHISQLPKLILGDDPSWIFYRSEYNKDGHVFDDWQGFIPFSPGELEDIRNNLEQITSYCERLRVPLLILTPPNKESIYSERVPSRFRHASLTRMTQLKSIAAKYRDGAWIDLEGPLLEAKAKYPYDLYYRGGTHWNELGAFIGYQQIMKRLHRWLPDISAYDESDFDHNPENLSSYENWYGFSTGQYFEFKLKPGIASSPKKKLKKLLIFHDSFLTSLRPFLALHFDQILDFDNFSLDQKNFYNFIDKEKPDVVIYEALERNIMEMGHFPQLKQ